MRPRTLLVLLAGAFLAIAVASALLGDWTGARWSLTVAAGFVCGAALERAGGPRLDARTVGTRGWALWRDDGGRWRWLVWHEAGIARGDAKREADARNDLGQELDALLERDARAGDAFLAERPRCGSCGTAEGEPCPAAPFPCSRSTA